MEQLTIWDAIENYTPPITCLSADRGVVYCPTEETPTILSKIWRNTLTSFNENWDWVYFIEAIGAGVIKIGISQNPEARLRSLQTASPTPLRLIVAVYGTANLERRLHRKFSPMRRNGEWFADCQEIRAEIERFTSKANSNDAQGNA